MEQVESLPLQVEALMGQGSEEPRRWVMPLLATEEWVLAMSGEQWAPATHRTERSAWSEERGLAWLLVATEGWLSNWLLVSMALSNLSEQQMHNLTLPLQQMQSLTANGILKTHCCH